jgi:hypothetical protein
MRGMYAPAGNMTGFTGTLVGRRYKPGQKYIQLVFKTTEGFKLSLSRNLNMVRSLSVGLTYWVEGPEVCLEQKTFIHEPVATLVQPKSSLFKRYRVFFAMGAVVMVVVIAGSVIALTKPSTPSAQPVAKKPAAQKTINTESKDNTPDASPSSNEQAQLSARAPSTTPTQINKTTAKNTPTITTASTPQASGNPAQQPSSTSTANSQTPASTDTSSAPEPSPPPPPPAPSPDPSGDTTP